MSFLRGPMRRQAAFSMRGVAYSADKNGLVRLHKIALEIAVRRYVRRLPDFCVLSQPPAKAVIRFGLLFAKVIDDGDSQHGVAPTHHR